jgi:hypothetical protein
MVQMFADKINVHRYIAENRVLNYVYYDGRIFPSFVQCSWEVSSPIFIGFLLLCAARLVRERACASRRRWIERELSAPREAGAHVAEIAAPSFSGSLSLLRCGHPALKNYTLYEAVAASTEGTFGSGTINSY